MPNNVVSKLNNARGQNFGRGGGLYRYTIRGAGLRNLILELCYCAFVTFPKKNSFTPCGERHLISGQGLAGLVIIFGEFNITLEIVES